MKIPKEIFDRMHIREISLFLDPCPVCGSKVLIRPAGFDGLDMNFYSAECGNDNGCSFLRNIPLVYKEIEEGMEAWTNMVRAHSIQLQNDFVYKTDPRL